MVIDSVNSFYFPLLAAIYIPVLSLTLWLCVPMCFYFPPHCSCVTCLLGSPVDCKLFKVVTSPPIFVPYMESSMSRCPLYVLNEVCKFLRKGLCWELVQIPCLEGDIRFPH